MRKYAVRPCCVDAQDGKTPLMLANDVVVQVLKGAGVRP